MKQLTREWLNSAKDDLGTIRHLIEDQLLTNVVAFHSQQAIEKSFKAIMEEEGLYVARTHNLQS
jgi:HEPN domain-containing protein